MRTPIGTIVKLYFKALLLVGIGSIVCALIVGLYLEKSLEQTLTALLPKSGMSTAQPISITLKTLRSARIEFKLSDDQQAILLSGNAITIFPDSTIDFSLYLDYQTTQSDEEHIILLSGSHLFRKNLASDKWAEDQTTYDDKSLPLDITLKTLTFSTLLHMLGIDLTENMLGWEKIDTSTFDGRFVTRFRKASHSSIQIPSFLGNSNEQIEATATEVLIGVYDHLPYLISCNLDVAGRNFLLRLHFYGFNEPLRLLVPPN